MEYPEGSTSVSASEPMVADLPDSIRRHRKLVDFKEWLMLRYPARLSLNAEVRRRLDIDAA